MSDITQIACEVEEALSYTDINLVNKIPEKIRMFFIEKSMEAEHYIPKFKKDIKLSEQDFSEETKSILSLLYRDYFCTEEQKAEIEKTNENIALTVV